MKTAILIHLLGWDAKFDSFTIDNGITLVNLLSHPANDLYLKLCEDDGIDDGSPYNFRTAIILNDDVSKKDYSFFPTEDPYSISSILINLLTLFFKGTLGHSRIIFAKNNSETTWFSNEIYDLETNDNEALVIFHSKLNEENLNIIQTIWNNLKVIKAYNINKSRIENALNYYYFSWNIHGLEQTAVSLSIVLETLFAPDTNTELTHQISFSIAKFTGINKQQRINIYKLVKSYYKIRSKIVHGDSLNEKEIKLIPDFFKFTSKLLLRIVRDRKLIEIFNDNKMRRSFLNEIMFK